VIHTASPFPFSYPKYETDLIRPAVEGTMSVLKACYENKVKKVVITSSIAAILSYGKTDKKNYTEDDWDDMANVSPYFKSKTLAE